jgi:NitT/TauT family transport system substrate-binding protein
MAGGTAIIPGITSGSLDIGNSNIGSLGAAYAHGLPVVVLAPGAVYDQKKQATALVVADPAIKTAAGLAGKIVAVNGLHDIVMFATTAWLTQNGADANAVKFVEIPFPEMPIAVQRGTVDAAVIAEPALSTALSPAYAQRVLGYPYDAVNGRKPFLITAWFTTQDWLKSHKDVARRFVDAIGETSRWANANPAQTAPILAKYIKLSPEVLASMTRSIYGRDLAANEIQPVLDLAFKERLFTPAVPAAAITATM